MVEWLSLFFKVGESIYSAVDDTKKEQRKRRIAKDTEILQAKEGYKNLTSEMGIRNLTSQGREFTSVPRLEREQTNAIKGIQRKYGF